jgi:hypothetical protein
MAGPPNKVLLPDNMDKELGDLRRRILGLETAGKTPQPFTFDESIDATHPMYIDFVLPAGIQSASAKLSFRFRLYRATSSTAGGTTGSDAGGGTGSGTNHVHASAAHTHHNTPSVGGSPTYALSNPAGLEVANGPVSGWNTDSTTPGNTGIETSHTHSEGAHTHSVGGSSLGVAEGASTSVVAIGVDGVDKTALLGGGPWAGATVDLDLTAVLPLGDGGWHYVTLTPAGQGRIVAILKLA